MDNLLQYEKRGPRDKRTALSNYTRNLGGAQRRPAAPYARPEPGPCMRDHVRDCRLWSSMKPGAASWGKMSPSS